MGDTFSCSRRLASDVMTRVGMGTDFLLQVLDLLYFSWLDLRGPVSGSVEDMAAGRHGVLGSAMRGSSMTVATLAWGEARLMRALPGGCGHFTCTRS